MALLPITTYAGLQSAVLRWMDDASISDEVPELIQLSENRLSRKIDSPEMEVSTILTLSDGAAVLPTNLMQLRSIYLADDTTRTKLRLLSEEDFNSGFTSDYTGRPSEYTIAGTTLMVRPLPDAAYPINITYKQMIPALSDANPTNWLLTKWPDLYLAHTLLTAVDYGYEVERLDWATNKAETLIEEVNRAGSKLRYGIGPLVAKAPVNDFSSYRR